MNANIYESEVLTVVDARADRSIPLKNEKSNPTWLRADWLWAASGVGPRKTAERLSRLPVKLKFTVYMHNGNHGHLKDVRTDVSSDSHINVVMGNNISTEENHIPLTPWMVLHRTAHCLSLHEFGNRDYLQCIEQAWMDLGGLSHGKSRLLQILDDVHARYSEFLEFILTMRSARSSKPKSHADFGAELLAQHYLGGVKFLRTKDWEERKSKLVDGEWKWKWNPTLQKMMQNPNETDSMLEKLEIRVGQDINRLFNDLVGRTISF